MRIPARFTGEVSCPHCGGTNLRMKDRRMRRPRHESWGVRHCVLALETRKWRVRGCARSFWQRFPGILPRMRATEPFRRGGLPEALRRHQPQPPGEAGTYRQRDRRALVRRFSAAWRANARPASARRSSALTSTSSPAARLRHHLLRSEKPQNL